jgi:hypothetical protein
MIIKDGTGSGSEARVINNRLVTKAVTSPLQHVVSESSQQAYQVSADIAIATSEQNLLLVKNTSSTSNIVLTYIRVQAAGAAAAGTAAYFNISVGGDYASGGTAITPTNMFVGSANAADGVFYDATGSAIVTSGTFTQIDRTYLDNDTYSKSGSLILAKGSSLLISHKGSTVAGQAYCRVSFYFDDETF